MEKPNIFQMLYWIATEGKDADRIAMAIILGVCALVLACIMWGGRSMVQSHKDFEEACANRAGALTDVINNPSAYSWVWVITGFGEYGEYCNLYAQKAGSSHRIELAQIDQYAEAKKKLDQKQIRVHCGPPGTVGGAS